MQSNEECGRFALHRVLCLRMSYGKLTVGCGESSDDDTTAVALLKTSCFQFRPLKSFNIRSLIHAAILHCLHVYNPQTLTYCRNASAFFVEGKRNAFFFRSWDPWPVGPSRTTATCTLECSIVLSLFCGLFEVDATSESSIVFFENPFLLAIWFRKTRLRFLLIFEMTLRTDTFRTQYSLSIQSSSRSPYPKFSRKYLQIALKSRLRHTEPDI